MVLSADGKTPLPGEIKPLVTIPLSGNDISNAIRKTNRHDAVQSTVQLFENAILEHFRSNDRRSDAWITIVPEIVHRYVRPQAAGPKFSTPSVLISEEVGCRDSARRLAPCSPKCPDLLLRRSFEPARRLPKSRPGLLSCQDRLGDGCLDRTAIRSNCSIFHFGVKM
jgi:hypothetical protein